MFDDIQSSSINFFPCEFGLASIKTAINSFSRNIKTTIIEMQLGLRLCDIYEHFKAFALTKEEALCYGGGVYACNREIRSSAN